MNKQLSSNKGGLATKLKYLDLREQKIQKYNVCPKLCLDCQLPLSYDSAKLGYTFCSKSCSSSFRNKHNDKFGQKAGAPSLIKGRVFPSRRKTLRENKCCVCCGLPLPYQRNVFCSWSCRKSSGFLSVAGRKRLSNIAKQRNFGGYRPHPNKGSRYKKIWFDSQWEIITAKSLDENGIQWERPRIGFIWSDQGNKYYPDFYLPEYNVYLDPKNDYLIKKDKIKIDQAQLRNGIKVIVLSEDNLTWENICKLL
jgi:hypothetical protein